MKNGVIFKKTKNDQGYSDDTFTVTIDGDAEVYMDTIQALLDMLAFMDDGSNILTQSTRWVLCNLIEYMLPSKKQMDTLAKLQEENAIQS